MGLALCFTECCDAVCSVCSDIGGTLSVFMSLPDISTITDLDPGGSCPECEAYATASELLAIDQATTQVLLDAFITAGCEVASDRTADTQCGYVNQETCGTVFSITRFACTYRTDGGNLRMFVGLLISYQDALLFTHTYRVSDDFLLATGSYSLPCAEYSHSATYTLCSGSTPTIGCSQPSAYTVTFAAA